MANRGVSGTLPGADPRWRPMFALASATFLTSLVVFLALVVSAACGSGGGAAGTATSQLGGQTQGPDEAATGAETAGGEPTAGSAATEPAQGGDEPTPEGTDGQVSGAGGTGGNNGGDRRNTGIQDNTPLVACGDILAPVDKQHRLAKDCAPGGLEELPAEVTNEVQYMTRPAAAAMLEMVEAAAAEGLSLYVASSYRSYETQVQLYQYWVDTVGEEEAARTSAQPGHSEHQLGTTADLTTQAVGFEPNDAFASTPEGRWVAENSWRFGFIVSYPPGKEGITGYAYEPWHVRWVDRAVAAQVRAGGKTLHEFLAR